MVQSHRPFPVRLLPCHAGAHGPGCAWSAETAARLWLFVLCGFALVALHWIQDPRAMDVSLMSRLFALSVFLLLWLCAALWLGVWKSWDSAILRDPVLMCYAAYFLLTLLSLFQAVNITAGWTDVFRTSAALVLLCLLCLTLPSVASWPLLLVRLGVVGALLSGGLGLYEMATKVGLGVHGRAQMEMITGLMSNVNLYAGFLNLLLPLGLLGVALLRGPWRLTAVVASVLVAALVILLQSRAAYVGLACGLFVAAGVSLLRWRQLGLDPRFRRHGALAMVLVAVLAVIFVIAGAGHPVVDRLRTVLEAGTRTIDGGRTVVWLSTLDMAADHWLGGVGAGNFTVRLHEYFDIDNPDFALIHPNWIRPHNDFLWVLAEKGIFGLMAFVGIFFFAVARCWRVLHTPPDPAAARVSLAILMALAAYAAGSFFDFPLERVSHQTLLAVYLAMAVVVGRAPVPAATTRGPDHRFRPAVFFFVVGPVLLVGAWYSAAALRQEWYVVQARMAVAAQDWEGMVTNAHKASTAWKTLDPFAIPVVFLEGTGRMLLAEHDAALQQFEEAAALIPSRTYILKAKGILHVARKEFALAAACFEQVLARSSGNFDTMIRLAQCRVEQGRAAEALQLLERVPEASMSERGLDTRRRARLGMEGELP